MYGITKLKQVCPSRTEKKYIIEEKPAVPNTLQERKNVKQSIQTAAKEVIGYKYKEKPKEWFDNESKQAQTYKAQPK
jgi:hypothetical protein